ncbi:MAG TPA: hypothetical protein VF723_03810, partial [Pyrinomonadaceae bacterium]
MTKQTDSKWHSKALHPILTGALLVVCLALAFAQRPRRAARQENDGRAATGRSITVKAGDDFQKALNAARAGDTILLEAGATFRGSFILPFKRGSGTDSDWITIRTSAPDSSLPGADARVSPAHAALLPKLVSPGQGRAALRTEAGAHHYRLIGLEFAPADDSAFVYDLLALGDGSEKQNSLDQVPHHLIIDRCFIHAHPKQSLKRGIALNSSHTFIINSYLSGFKQLGEDSQAIC